MPLSTLENLFTANWLTVQFENALMVLRCAKATDVAVLILALQFCAGLGSFLPIFAYLIVQELSQSHTAALITAILLIFGE